MANSTLSPVRKPNEKFAPEQVAEALTHSKGLISVAARQLGCDVNTVRRYIKQYVSVQKAKEEAREGIVDLAEARLFQAIDRGESWAISMMLRTVGRDRGYVERQEVTGKDGDAIEVKHVAEQFDRRVIDLVEHRGAYQLAQEPDAT